MELDVAQRRNGPASGRKPKGLTKYSKKDLKCYNCGKTGHFKWECRSLIKEYEKKRGNNAPTARRTVQLASKGKLPMRESMREAVSELREKADNKMTPEEVDDLLQSKMPGEEKEVPQGFLEEIIGQAKLVQEILDSLGTMLIEVQKNLHLLPADSQQRILQALQQVIEHHRQRQAKAEIQ